jgi:predicted Zn-dependent protease
LVLGALEYQPDDYLVKPIIKDVLLRRIFRAVKKKQELRPLEEALASGDLQKAIVLCDRCAESSPSQAFDLLRIKADLCISSGDYVVAEGIFSTALAERDFAWARFGIGRIRVLQGRFSEARQILQALIAENRSHLEVYDWLASAQEGLGRPAEAIAALQASLDLSAKSVRRHRRLGELALSENRPDVAERAFRRAIREGQDSCFAGAEEYVQLATLLTQQQQGTKSLSVLRDGRKALRNAPVAEMQIASAQAMIYHQQGAKADAKRLLSEALSLRARNPGMPSTEATLNLADVCLTVGDRESGLQLMKHALHNATDDAAATADVTRLLANHGLEQEQDAVLNEGRAELISLEQATEVLLEQNRLEDAATLLMSTADRLPRNRQINLKAAKLLLNLMRRRGRDQAYLYRLRCYIERLQAQGEKSEQFVQAQLAYRELIAS